MLEEFPKQEENARKWNIIKLLLTVCRMLLDTTARQANEYEHKQSVLPLRDSHTSEGENHLPRGAHDTHVPVTFPRRVFMLDCS